MFLLRRNFKIAASFSGLFLCVSFCAQNVNEQIQKELIEKLFGVETPEQKQAAQTYQTVEFECRRSLESTPQVAISKCQTAVDVARQLAPQRRIERSNVLTMLGQALVVDRRFADALSKFEEAVEIRSGDIGGRNDDGVAGLLELEATTYYSMQNSSKGNEFMEEAIKSYEGAIKQLPSMKSQYSRQLQATLRRYADIKRRMGDTAAAVSLSKRADDLGPAIASASNSPSEQFRIAGGIRLMGATGALLTDDDLKKIRALVPAGASPIWMVIGSPIGTYGKLDWQVKVYLQPETTSGNIRMGRLLTLSADLPAADQFSAIKTWKQTMVPYRYGQDRSGGRDFQEVRSEKDIDRPFEVVEIGSQERFGVADVARIIAFVRTQGAAAPAGPKPRLSTDVQPWPIQQLMRWTPSEAEAILVNPTGPGAQSVRVRFGTNGVSILQMR